MAAGRAAEAGFTKVAVLSEGVKGWKGAGRTTETVSPAVTGE